MYIQHFYNNLNKVHTSTLTELRISTHTCIHTYMYIIKNLYIYELLLKIVDSGKKFKRVREYRDPVEK